MLIHRHCQQQYLNGEAMCEECEAALDEQREQEQLAVVATEQLELLSGDELVVALETVIAKGGEL